MASRREAREWAVQLLFQQDFNPGELAPVFEAFWAEHRAGPKARQFVEEAVTSVQANRERIDSTITHCAQNWELSRMAGVDRNIIRLAVYEMLFRTDIPPAVSINEAIELAKTLGDVGSPRFVNGVLDRLRKEFVVGQAPPRTSPPS